MCLIHYTVGENNINVKYLLVLLDCSFSNIDSHIITLPFFKIAKVVAKISLLQLFITIQTAIKIRSQELIRKII